MPDPERPHKGEASYSKIALSQSDVREAARLFRVFAGAIDQRTEASGSDGPMSEHDRIMRARIILNSRRLRDRHFNRAMFGEPGWDILLVLYVTEGRQTVSQLAKWIEIPLTTATRWIDYLAKERLVEREPHPNDKRVMFIRLLKRGRDLLDEYLMRTPWDARDALEK